MKTHKNMVKHKSAKLFMTYAVGKLEAAINIRHLILSTSSQRVSMLELVCQSQQIRVSTLELVSQSQLVRVAQLVVVSQSWLVRVGQLKLISLSQSQLVKKYFLLLAKQTILGYLIYLWEFHNEDFPDFVFLFLNLL